MMEAALATPMRILGRLLEARTGQILTESRSWRVEVALGPVLKAHRLPGLEALVALVAADPGGAAAMDAVHALLNNETSFFRDAAVFRMIGDELLPRLAARAADQADGRSGHGASAARPGRSPIRWPWPSATAACGSRARGWAFWRPTFPERR